MLDNDYDPDTNDILHVVAVDTTNTVGSVTDNGDGIFTYDPGPNFDYLSPADTDTDSFRYTVSDGYGSTDTAEVTITITGHLVEVVDWWVERYSFQEEWVGVADDEWSWVDDELRWTAETSPEEPYVNIDSIDWLKKPWDSRDDESVTWEVFASASGSSETLGNPGVGVWAIVPQVYYWDASMSFLVAARRPTPRWRGDAKIVSVEFEGIKLSDGATNLSSNNPADLGGGFKFIYGKNKPGGALHNRFNIKVYVTPNETGIPITGKLVDADDPTDHDGPIDSDPGLTDNVYNGAPVTHETRNSTKRPGEASATAKFTMLIPAGKAFAGDNFRFVQAARPDGLTRIKPRSSITSPETSGRLFYDENDNDVHGPSEAIVDESNPVKITGNTIHSSPLVTIWRRLNLEVDTMAAPIPNVNYGFYAGDPNPGAAMPKPDTSALAAAFRKGFVEINEVTDSSISAQEIKFQRKLGADATAARNLLKAHNQLTEEDGYWVAYIAGVYELDTTKRDNDPDTQQAVMGVAYDDRRIAIPNEVIRDVANQAGRQAWTANQISAFEKAVVVHEVGHLFDLKHDNSAAFGSHAMRVHLNETEEGQLYDASHLFNDTDIRKIRRFKGT